MKGHVFESVEDIRTTEIVEGCKSGSVCNSREQSLTKRDFLPIDDISSQEYMSHYFEILGISSRSYLMVVLG